MKSMEEYINEVYEKYEQTEKQHQKYKTVKMKPYNPLPTLCGIAACIALFCAFGVGIKFYNIEEKQDIKYAESEEKEDGTIIFTKYIKIDGRINNIYFKKMLSNSNLVAIVSDYIEKDTMYTYVRSNFIIETIGLIDINRVLYNDRKVNEGSISCSKLCGTIAISEIEKDKNIDINEWEKLYIGKNLNSDTREKAYFQQVTSKGCEFEEGKQYLVFLSYNEEDDIYEIFDLAYGIMEYNPTTNQVKNIDTGEFEDFNWDLIAEKNEQ